VWAAIVLVMVALQVLPGQFARAVPAFEWVRVALVAARRTEAEVSPRPRAPVSRAQPRKPPGPLSPWRVPRDAVLRVPGQLPALAAPQL
jgi:hypothetical protein